MNFNFYMKQMHCLPCLNKWSNITHMTWDTNSTRDALSYAENANVFNCLPLGSCAPVPKGSMALISSEHLPRKTGTKNTIIFQVPQHFWRHYMERDCWSWTGTPTANTELQPKERYAGTVHHGMDHIPSKNVTVAPIRSAINWYPLANMFIVMRYLCS